MAAKRALPTGFLLAALCAVVSATEISSWATRDADKYNEHIYRPTPSNRSAPIFPMLDNHLLAQLQPMRAFELEGTLSWHSSAVRPAAELALRVRNGESVLVPRWQRRAVTSTEKDLQWVSSVMHEISPQATPVQATFVSAHLHEPDSAKRLGLVMQHITVVDEERRPTLILNFAKVRGDTLRAEVECFTPRGRSVIVFTNGGADTEEGSVDFTSSNVGRPGRWVFSPSDECAFNSAPAKRR